MGVTMAGINRGVYFSNVDVYEKAIRLAKEKGIPLGKVISKLLEEWVDKELALRGDPKTIKNKIEELESQIQEKNSLLDYVNRMEEEAKQKIVSREFLEIVEDAAESITSRWQLGEYERNPTYPYPLCYYIASRSYTLSLQNKTPFRETYDKLRQLVLDNVESSDNFDMKKDFRSEAKFIAEMEQLLAKKQRKENDIL